jgi:hypothetical protein
MSDTEQGNQDNGLTEQDKLKSENEALKKQLEELQDVHSQRGTEKTGKLSWVSDFINSILVGFVDSHSALTKNFGGGFRGALVGATFLIVFFIGLTTIGYVTYETINSSEQKVFMENEPSQ